MKMLFIKMNENRLIFKELSNLDIYKMFKNQKILMKTSFRSNELSQGFFLAYRLSKNSKWTTWKYTQKVLK